MSSSDCLQVLHPASLDTFDDRGGDAPTVPLFVLFTGEVKSFILCLAKDVVDRGSGTAPPNGNIVDGIEGFIDPLPIPLDCFD